MSKTIELLLNRRSVRAFEPRPVESAVKDQILRAAMRAPTAGNMMLYSIVEVADQSIKDTLARTCDDQPFIAKAPLVLLFLADYQRWYDYFLLSGVEDLSRQLGQPLRKPEEGDLMLACCDALIAAQTAVIAAEALGLGSCYIGDIMENYETHRDLFALPPYTFPICLVCFGYPTEQQRTRPQPSRFGREFIVFTDRYQRLGPAELERMFAERAAQLPKGPRKPEEGANFGQAMYQRKFASAFSMEMSRSVRLMLEAWI